MPDALPLKRLKLRKQFLTARGGHSQRRKSLVVQAVPRPHPPGPWIGDGYTATKKVGHAPKRNRAKRRLRAAARELLPQFGCAGCDYVFIARASTSEVEWSRLLDDMKSALISLATSLDAASPRHTT